MYIIVVASGCVGGTQHSFGRDKINCVPDSHAQLIVDPARQEYFCLPRVAWLSSKLALGSSTLFVGLEHTVQNSKLHSLNILWGFRSRAQSSSETWLTNFL